MYISCVCRCTNKSVDNPTDNLVLSLSYFFFEVKYHPSQGRIQDLAMGGGGGMISSEASYIYERSEYKSAGGPADFFWEFSTPESEFERNLTNYFIIFLLLFY